MFVLQLKTSTSEFAKIDRMFQRGHTTLPCSWNPSGADANEKLFMASCCLIICLFFWRFAIRRSETITVKDFKVMRKRLYSSSLVFCVPRKVCSIVKIIPKIDCMGDEWRPMSDDWWLVVFFGFWVWDNDKVPTQIVFTYVSFYSFQPNYHIRVSLSEKLRKTSQELRMLSSVTINCQITKIVMNSGSQLLEL